MQNDLFKIAAKQCLRLLILTFYCDAWFWLLIWRLILTFDFDAWFWRLNLTLYFDALFWHFILTDGRTDGRTTLTLESLCDWKGKNKALEQVIKNVKVGWKRRMEHLMKIATLEEEINILEKIIYNHFCFITFFLLFFLYFHFCANLTRFRATDIQSLLKELKCLD